MTRARDRARSLRRPTIPTAVRAPAVGLAVAVALFVAGCDAVITSPSGTDIAPSGAITGSPGPGTSDVASSPVPADTTTPTEPPTGQRGPSDTPAPSGGSSGSAADCTGLPANRDFFAAAAAALEWDVYCGVLPDGWFIQKGSNYRLADGGRMVVIYSGPQGAHLELHEGSFCADDGGCVPSGRESGPAAFGDRAGTLVVLEGGGYAVVVDRGASTSWLAIGANLDEAAFLALTSALHRVAE